MSAKEIDAITQYVRAANYLTVAQLYLKDNALRERPLSADDIKPRLLGHWGTCPGVNFTYAQLNALIKRRHASMLFVLGPGHGFAAVQAQLFLEGTLQRYYPRATPTKEGIGYIAHQFSWPYGFPSHSNPGTPGVILEGGELGYSLATAYGAALDNPSLIVACMVGDGEAETGPAATAWHLHRFLDPATSGAVLPILHCNGYKISGPTIFGRMSDAELHSLFVGYGYEPYIVSDPNIYKKMYAVLDRCYAQIRLIQKNARAGKRTTAKRWPMIILKTPKGWTGIKELHGKKIEGNNLSHQIVGPNAKTDPVELKALDRWLASYSFEELFSPTRGFSATIRSLIPPRKLCMGENNHAFSGRIMKPLRLPDAKQYSEPVPKPGVVGSSSMRRAGEYLAATFKKNPKTFRLFSPDETYSNKLDAVFSVTKRVTELPIKSWDLDYASQGGVIEMLSEHSLQGLMQGYVLTGRHGVFASYEAFIQIVASMADQYAKFLSVARTISWRGPIPSFNYILTSSGWRQEHNGFSHQNPGFINDMLERQGKFVKVYFPPDGNATLAVLQQCLRSTNCINIIVAGKTQEPRWLSFTAAQRQLKTGLSVWDFASDHSPDLVFAAVGDYLTTEALAAISIIKQHAPNIRIRFVNIMELTCFGVGDDQGKKRFADFDHYFTADKPVIFNFHGYPQTLKQLLFDYIRHPRIMSVHGYTEHGSTTTPFDLHIRNKTSRYHLALDAYAIAADRKLISRRQEKTLSDSIRHLIDTHRGYVIRHGVDPEEISQWQWDR